VGSLYWDVCGGQRLAEAGEEQFGQLLKEQFELGTTWVKLNDLYLSYDLAQWFASTKI
jgi:hypothetical protein